MTTQDQQIAEALKTDPVYVSTEAKDAVNQKLLDTAHAKIDALDFDVFVIVQGDGGVDRDQLEQIKVFNGGEGSFIMIDTGSDLAVDYAFDDQHELQMQVMDQLSVARDQWSHSTPSQTKLNILLDLYADPQEAPEWETGQEAPGSEVETVDSPNGTATLFLGGSVLVLALVIALIWFAKSRRDRARATRTRRQFELPSRLLNRVDALQRRSLRESISDDTTDLAAEITQLQTRNLGPEAVAGTERALDAYQIARSIVDDEDAERIDLAGAMVLLRQAGREIAEVKLAHTTKRGSRRSQKTKTDGLPQSLCTINPLHGEAQTNASVSPEHQGHLAGKGRQAAKTVRVPVCADCLSDLQTGREPQWLFDGDRPYVEGDSIWGLTLFGAIGADLVTALNRQGS